MHAAQTVEVVDFKLEASMWRSFWLTLLLFGIPAVAFGQADSSDSEALHALLSEVRTLHQDLLSSMARVQKAQILLSRLQIQQASVVRASDRSNTARGKLSDAQDHIKRTMIDIKRFEDSLNTEQNTPQQKAIRDMLGYSKSELEDWTAKEQQLQTEEIEAAQQLRTEQDKLTMLEAQLEDLFRSLGNGAAQVGRMPH
jgi:DNA repair exonuclease SbcCD ATPase subunit